MCLAEAVDPRSTQAFRKRALCPCCDNVSPRPREVGAWGKKGQEGPSRWRWTAMSGACGVEACPSWRASGHHHELLSYHNPVLACC